MGKYEWTDIKPFPHFLALCKCLIYGSHFANFAMYLDEAFALHRSIFDVLFAFVYANNEKHHVEFSYTRFYVRCQTK